MFAIIAINSQKAIGTLDGLIHHITDLLFGTEINLLVELSDLDAEPSADALYLLTIRGCLRPRQEYGSRRTRQVRVRKIGRPTLLL